MPEVFNVKLPYPYADLMGYFDIIHVEWIGLYVEPACVGGFAMRLLLIAVSPIVAFAVLVLSVVCHSLRNRSSPAAGGEELRDREDGARGFMAILHQPCLDLLPGCLFAAYVLVTGISLRIFSSFACDRFHYADAMAYQPEIFHEFLHSDLSVRCYSGDAHYPFIRSVASVLVVLWPIGVPSLFGFLLLRCRKAIVYRQPNPLSKAIRFLYSEYK